MEINPLSAISYVTAIPDAAIPITGYVTPPQIVSAYNIPAGTGSNTKVAIFSLGGGFLQSDLNKDFVDLYNAGLISTSTAPTINQVLLDGATGVFSTSDGYSIENTLDIYCVATLVPQANITIYIGNPNNGSTSWANVFNRAIADNNDIITVSYAIDETLLANFGFSGDDLHAPLANAAAQGISVFVATGDYEDEGNQPTGVATACYPASSPNAIAVGGTYLSLTGSNTRASEIVNLPAQNNGPSGGISTLFAVPTWQGNLTYTTYPGNVTVTMTANTLGNTGGNPVGRGVPDISGPYYNYTLYYNGSAVSVGGTSASTPVMAGMMSRFISTNHRRPPPNSLHSLFYSHASSFNKSSANATLTVGNNSLSSVPGYKATGGWDPVTGLGVPFGNLVYQNVTSAGLAIKNSGNTWGTVGNVHVKTGVSTWANVQHIWVKTSANTWSQTY
jgi:kumamolisin